MDPLEFVQYVSIVVSWVVISLNYWMIFRNRQTAKRLDRLELLYDTAIKELEQARDRYINRLVELES